MPASPDFPAGPPPTDPVEDEGALREHLELLALAPGALRTAVTGLTDGQLDVHYRNWTSRQIVHHLADAHANAYLRTKLALTEDDPTVKPYAENAWASLADARRAPLDAPLALLEAVHDAWLSLLGALEWPDGFARTFRHPELRRSISVSDTVAYCDWHARHHTAQINWLAEHYGWR